MIDLHTHTTASDGEERPAELVAHAARLGLKALAITDHDTLGGLDEALAAGARHGLHVIPGVEISTSPPWPEDNKAHMLGYFVDPAAEELGAALAWFLEQRETRNTRIIQKFCDLGMPITEEEVRAEAGDGVVGRPHIARVLIKKGYCADKTEVFDKYLADGGPAYVERGRLEMVEMMSLIRQAGGLPVLAHPGLLKLPIEGLPLWLERMKDNGLAGVEVNHSAHRFGTVQRLTQMAERLGLTVTGGSDYHGAVVKPEVGLGRGAEGVELEDTYYENLLAARGD